MPEVNHLAESIPHQLFLSTISQDPDHSAQRHSIPGNSDSALRPF